MSVLTGSHSGSGGSSLPTYGFIRLGILDERLTPVGIPEGSEYIRHTFALPVTIEDGGWIGGGAIILPGVTIGEGGVIGAGSVVAENIQANSLVPAG